MFEQEIAVLQVLFPNLRFDDSRYSACVCMCSKNIQQLTVDVVVKSFMWSFLWKLEKRDRQLRQNTSASLMWRFGRLSFSAVQLVQVLRESILEDVETESGKYLLLFNHLMLTLYSLKYICLSFRRLGSNLAAVSAHLSPASAWSSWDCINRNPRDQSRVSLFSSLGSMVIWDMGLHRRWDETGETGEV